MPKEFGRRCGRLPDRQGAPAFPGEGITMSREAAGLSAEKIPGLWS